MFLDGGRDEPGERESWERMRKAEQPESQMPVKNIGSGTPILDNDLESSHCW
jgi:hypothetical protein